MKKFVGHRLFYPALLIIIVSLVCLKNFTPGTFLAGWDNLMPELNIWLNLKRSFLAVWQEYQGLGLVGGMGHATDLIRQLILLPFSLALPPNLVRYLWHFAMLFLGTLGIFFGLKNDLKFKPTTAFISSLFYLLNFGTVQYFWASLESFSSFWGFFPWLIFSLWNYLDNRSPTNLKKLILINLLAIPSFYVQTLFVVYFVCISLVMFSWLIYQISARSQCVKNTRVSTANLIFGQLKIILLILTINSFWLLPQIYFLKANLNSTVSGIGNFMSNEESFARNQFHGYLPDFLLLSNYYLDFPDAGDPFMGPWITHFANQYILICGYILSFVLLIGFLYLLSRPKKLDHKKLSLILIFFLTAVALLSATPPFAQINSLLRLSELINQIFRSPFTKFVVPAAFSFSLLTAYGLKAIINLFSQIKYPQYVSSILHTSYFIFLCIFAFPVFTGNLISPKLRPPIPTAYFDLANYLKAQPSSARIANLPSGSFWGWSNYRWGYRGSGFLWYLIPQPILDRAFDAWNMKNEQYYWELDQALQKNDPALLSQILKKYSIEYILFDNNIYFPDEFIYSKLALSTSQLLNQTPGIKLEKQFGQISLYRTLVTTSPFLLQNPTTTSTTGFLFEDVIFQQHQDYITSTASNSLDYPFLNLFANRLQSEFPFLINLDNDTLTITRQSDHSKISLPLDNSANLIKTTSQPPVLLSNQHNSQLLAFNFPNASLGKSYLVKVDYQYLTGLPLTIAINSDNHQYQYLYTRLDKNSGHQTAWFILPAHETYDFNQGITVLFNNNSLNNLPTQNKIFDVNLYPIPYYDLIQQSTPPSDTVSTRTDLSYKNHLFYYRVSLAPPFGSSPYLVLPQSFSPGWLAFYFQGAKPVFLTNHLLVNNWANGWELPDTVNKNIYILFWPQLLEFIGFAFLLAIPLLISIKKNHRQNRP